jgi:glycosyltransferase involved in cell wall biosynthesis
MATSANRSATLLAAPAAEHAYGNILPGLMAYGERPATRRPPQTGVAAAHLRVTSLSVVIPARNEELNLGGLLTELQQALGQLPQLEFQEIIVVDDGSCDSTPELARAHGVAVVRHPEGLGNGAAVKRGIREAKGDWILLLDGDGQHPPAAIAGMLAMAERHDLVVGSRGGQGGSLHRNFANRVYNRFASYVSSKPIPDLTSGFRLLRADVAKDLVWLLPNTFSYPTTITMSMLRGGFAVGFLPFAVRQRQGKSHIRLLQDGSRFFLIILRIATFYAPLRVFVPLSLATFAAGLGWYAYTWFLDGRFTNMAVLLIGQAMMLFALGLISEQVAALRFQRLGRMDER